jgi:exodeoxyribonuclease VII small subunit
MRIWNLYIGIIMTQNNLIENMSFEEALKELESIVKKIDSGEETLESAITSFERGSELKKHCQSKLDQAKLKIEKIIQNADGSISSQEVEI